MQALAKSGAESQYPRLRAGTEEASAMTIDPSSITRRGVIAGGTALAAAAATPAFAQQAGANIIKLRILETTDIHVHVHSYDYYRDQPDDTLGLARVAALVDKARGEAKNTLLFENGDFLQGSPMGDLAASEKGFKGGDTHPISGR
jgi:2',3'-cyclic-nucleotide 2'-phosphodiesterase / 3'-nucleotidase